MVNVKKLQDVLVVPLSPQSNCSKKTWFPKLEASKNPAVATNAYLGKHKNGTSTDDPPQQVFHLPSMSLAQEFP